MASPTINSFTAPAAGLSSTSDAGTAIGDLVVVVTFERAGAGIPTHTIVSGYTEILSHGHDDGSTDGRLSVAYIVATASGAQSYAGWTSSVGTETWTGLLVIDTGTYGLPIQALGVTATGTGAPNPPNLLGLPSEQDFLAVAISAWHLSAGATVTPAHASYTIGASIAGSATAELAIATLAVASPVINIDPGAYTDDVTPNGTCSITLAIPEAFSATAIAYTGAGSNGATAGGDGLTATLNVVSGQIVVVHSTGWDTEPTLTLNDTSSHTWTQVVKINGAGTTLFHHYAIMTLSGRITITQDFSINQSFRSIQAMGFVNVDPSDPLEDSDSVSDTTANPTTPSMTAAADGALFVGSAGNGSNVTYTPGGSFVEVFDDLGDSDSQSQYWVQTTAASLAIPWTASSTTHNRIGSVYNQIVAGAPATSTSAGRSLSSMGMGR